MLLTFTAAAAQQDVLRLWQPRGARKPNSFYIAAMLVSTLTRATVPPMRTQRAAVAMSRPPDERPLEAKVIDFAISSFSVLFLPIIAVVGLSLAAATGLWDGGELRIGAPSRAERTSKPTAERPVLPPVLLLSSSQDPVLSDLQDGPAAMLSKPAAEQQRQEGLQALEDERLVTCRASQDFDQACRFALHQRSSQRLPLRALVTPPNKPSRAPLRTQCFFFGSSDAIDSRRMMEGSGSLSFSRLGDPRATELRPPLRIPTW